MGFKKGYIPWSKGLTKELDVRVKKMGQNISKSLRGHILSKETKKKISESHKGLPVWNKGKHHSNETRKKISNNRKGIYHSSETKKKMSKSRKGLNTWSKGRHFSIETKKKMSISHLGIKNYNYKGNITPLYRLIRSLSQYKQWRSDVFQRDNWTCQTCGKRCSKGKAIYLEAHHIKEFMQIIKDNNITSVIEAQLCKELWNIDNGITLCVECHGLTKKGRGKYV